MATNIPERNANEPLLAAGGDLPGRDAPERGLREAYVIRDPGAVGGGNNNAGDDAAGKPSFASLMKELRDETTALLRQEVALAKTEMTEKAAKAGRNAGYLAAGGVLLLAGLICLLTFAAYTLAALLDWAGVPDALALCLGWLIVGLAVCGAGYVLLRKGIDAFKNFSVVPEKTVQTLQEDKQWATNKISG